MRWADAVCTTPLYLWGGVPFFKKIEKISCELFESLACVSKINEVCVFGM